MMKKLLPFLCASALALSLTACAGTINNSTADTASNVTFTFTDSGVTAAGETDTGYEIDGTALTITSSGTYTVSGSCADGSIKVKKSTTGVTLVLDGLTLTSENTAAITCGKSSEVTILVSNGTENSLSDTEQNNDDNYPENENAENAVIKCKDGSTVTLCGDGELTVTAVGSRVSLAVGFFASIIVLVIGLLYGSISGYVGGMTDIVMMRIVDIIYSLPYMFFVIILVAVFGRSVLLLFVALGAVQWLTVARIVRGQVLSIKEKEFIQAGRAIGAGHLRIILHHLLPNVLGPVVVYTTLTVPAVMLQEAFLSFLGLGVPPPASSWGTLIADGASAINALRIYWWLLLFPGGAMALTLFAMNFLGDGLRDAIDPQLR